jgi:hypothetical protein
MDTTGTYLGTNEDIEVFAELWRENLAEMSTMGGEILPTARTLAFFRRVYLNTSQLGCAVFGADGNAVYLWTPLESPWDTRWGKAAVGHGAYVRPVHRRKGWATRVRNRGILEMKRLGCEVLIGGWFHDNPVEQHINLQFGYRPYHTNTVLMLNEVD